LVRWFTDAAIGAVAGNAKVGNRINMITRWQALEYIVAQNLERRALSALDTLTVVPGAVGAWRRDVLRELGGFPADTLAEDQDLTIHIQTEGYRVHFDPAAVAWTEAPATVGGLAKQRFRWAYGTLQCLWKYRGITFNADHGELGLVALPQVWLFQILLTTLAPVADLLLLWQLVGEYINYAQHVGTYTRQSADRGRVLRDLHRGGPAGGDDRLCDGKGRGLASALVAAAAALRLSPDHVLRGAAFAMDRAARAVRRLGQAGASWHGQGACLVKIPTFLMARFSVKIAAGWKYADIARMAMHGFMFGHGISRQEFQILAAIDQTFGHQMNHAFRAFLHLAFRQEQA
jgi:hypothetical protein